MGQFIQTDSNGEWVVLLKEHLHIDGFAIVSSVLKDDFLVEARDRMYTVKEKIEQEIGIEKLALAKELGVLRLMMKFDPFFLKFLEIPELLKTVDCLLSETAIMHLQNGFILPSIEKELTPSVFQNNYHMDFPRILNGYFASLNIFFAIDEFRADNGALRLVPASHQQPNSPSLAYLNQNEIEVICPAGSMVVFDSTLWHAAGLNYSGANRLAINHQFTRSWIKQQFDYVRALGAEHVALLPARTQQLLGFYTRVVVSLDEYYRPEADRLYRKGQG